MGKTCIVLYELLNQSFYVGNVVVSFDKEKRPLFPISPLPVDWKVYDVLLCHSALNPDKMHGDLAHAALRQRFRSDGKRRPLAHDA